MLRHTVVDSPLGFLTLVVKGPELIGVYYEGHWTHPDISGFGEKVALSEDELLRNTAGQIHDFLGSQRRNFDLPYRTVGDPFQQAVWQKLQNIPYGHTVTYGEIAEELGNKNLARRVGQAVGSNPLSMIIPCHRVMGKNGKITGYAGGLERKQYLLELEESLAEKRTKLF